MYFCSGVDINTMFRRSFAFEQRLHQYDLTIQRLFRQDERCQRLAEVGGVGPLIATALVAAVGDASDFKHGCELAAYLGLVARHRASGGRTLLLGIGKRGDRYLRTLLIQGACAALRTVSDDLMPAASGPPGSSLVGEPMWRRLRSLTKMPRVLWACSAEGRAIDQRRFPPASPKPAVEGNAGGKRLLPT